MREIVVRKIEGIIKRIKGIKGATIFENGKVILILDPTSLLEKEIMKVMGKQSRFLSVFQGKEG